jgi:hypothetical protein
LSSGYHDKKRGALPWAITEAQVEEDRRQARPGSENDKEDTYGLIFRLNTNPGPFGIEQSITTGVDLERNEFDYKENEAPDQVRGAIRSDYSITKDKIG